MNMYAKINNSILIKYPYTMQNLFDENPCTSFDERFSLEEWFNQTEEHTVKKSYLAIIDSSTIVLDHDPYTHKQVFLPEPIFIENKWQFPAEIKELSVDEKEKYLQRNPR